MTIKRLRKLCPEVFIIPHQLKPCFMSSIFKVKLSDRPVRSKQNRDLKIWQKKFGVPGPIYRINYHHILKMLKNFLLLNAW